MGQGIWVFIHKSPERESSLLLLFPTPPFLFHTIPPLNFGFLGQWEDKLRSECSRLKAELDELHAEEKHLAVESMKVQKEQEIRKLKQSWEQRQEEMTKEVNFRINTHFNPAISYKEIMKLCPVCFLYPCFGIFGKDLPHSFPSRNSLTNLNTSRHRTTTIHIEQDTYLKLDTI